MSNELIVALDIETTGLDVRDSQILEVGIVIANKNFEILASRNWLMKDMVSWDKVPKEVVTMHNTRHMSYGYESLITDLANARNLGTALSEGNAAQRIIGWLESHGVDKKSCALTGSTISFDRGFLARYMSDLNDWFDYHSVDISSIQIAIQMFGPTKDLYKIGKPTDRKIHRAIPDCEDSLLKYQWEVACMKMGLNHIQVGE